MRGMQITGARHSRIEFNRHTHGIIDLFVYMSSSHAKRTRIRAEWCLRVENKKVVTPTVEEKHRCTRNPQSVFYTSSHERRWCRMPHLLFLFLFLVCKIAYFELS